MNKNLKISVVTGKRGGYDAILPMLHLFPKEGIDYQLLVCDQHLLPEFGQTIKQIRLDLPLTKIALIEGGVDRSASVGYMQTQMYLIIQGYEPDYIFVYGDRADALAGAITGLYLDIPVIHSQGGDVTGGIDDKVRNAISQIADIHFVSTPEASRAVLQMDGHGDIIVVGDQHLDRIYQKGSFGLLQPDPRTIIFLYHPHLSCIITERECYLLYSAIEELSKEFTTIGIYPCNDENHELVIHTLQDSLKAGFLHKLHRNLPGDAFLNLMASSACLVGNSSAGRIEAPCFHLPTVEIGNRQMGRLKHENLYFAKIWQDIAWSVHIGIENRTDMDLNPYWAGGAAKKIIKHLLERKDA